MSKIPIDSLQWFLDKLNATNGTNYSLSNLTVGRPEPIDPAVFQAKNPATNTMLVVSDSKHSIMVGYVRQPASAVFADIEMGQLTTDTSLGLTWEEKFVRWVEKQSGHKLDGEHVSTVIDYEHGLMTITYDGHYALDGVATVRGVRLPARYLPDSYPVKDSDSFTKESTFGNLEDSWAAVVDLFNGLNPMPIQPSFDVGPYRDLGTTPGRTAVTLTATDPLDWWAGSMDLTYNRVILTDLTGVSERQGEVSNGEQLAQYSPEYFAKRIRDEHGFPCTAADVTVTAPVTMEEYLTISFRVENAVITTKDPYQIFCLNGFFN